MAKQNPTPGEIVELLSRFKNVRTVTEDELPKAVEKEAPKKVHTVKVSRETLYADLGSKRQGIQLSTIGSTRYLDLGWTE